MAKNNMKEEFDYCEECRIYGDDYCINEYGELECRCNECMLNVFENEEE